MAQLIMAKFWSRSAVALWLMAGGLIYCVSPLQAFGWQGGETRLALSEIKREELPPPGGNVTNPGDTVNPTTQVPAPDPIGPAMNPDGADPELPIEKPADGTEGEGDSNDPARPNLDPDAPLPVIEYDLTKLPEAVMTMHGKLVEAAKSGSLENLRALIGSGDEITQFSLGGTTEDPLKYLLSLSGDEGGQEILAILLEILDAGYVHLDIGTPQELYVWPYFFAIPLEKLDARQKVELFKIVTSGDVEDMKSFGAYIFYRAGISPDGKWRFFLAGE
jgi:hypothetical protein